MDNQNQVEFMGDQSYKSRVILGSPERPRIVNFLLKTGLVKNETQSKKFLLGFIIACLFVSLFVLFYYVIGFGGSDEVIIRNPELLKPVSEVSK